MSTETFPEAQESSERLPEDEAMPTVRPVRRARKATARTSGGGRRPASRPRLESELEDAAHREMAKWLEEHPRATAAEAFEVGQDFFARLALSSHDLRAWCATQKIRLAFEAQALSHALEERRVKVMEEKASQATDDDKVVPLTPEEQEARLKAIFGIA